MKHRIGVCSWSLRPQSPVDLAEKVRATGLVRVQLALDPLRTGRWDAQATADTLAAAGLKIESGMLQTHGEDYSSLAAIRDTGGLRPDGTWRKNLEAARANAKLARRLGLELVTFHAGFLPEQSGDPERAKLIGRLRTFCEVFADEGVRLGLETGQETAATLAGVLDELDHPAAGVNFDPANMILYGMGDPVAALRLLEPHVRQIHVKDALPSDTPGEWGSEVRAGTGRVDWKAFLRLARELGVAFLIEREAGEERVVDIAAARALVERELGPSA
ncbi:MAG TPA: sugar phosphate isomerase/epimerase family protein [Planctomycetota bacterium]|nr:sugar phosphate isomerase/epimerase family protein [Planctomycetota bacterium]